MKKIAAAIFLLLAAAGCKSQIPSNPTVYTCPLATTGTWTALETSAAEVTGVSTVDTPATGTWCYGVTSIVNTVSPIQQSASSNIVMVTTTASLTKVDLAWTAPTSGTTPTGYIAYRIAAVSSTILAPTQSSPTTTAKMEPSQPIPAQTDLALNAPMHLAVRAK